MHIFNIKLSQFIFFISIGLTNLFTIDDIPPKYHWENDDMYARRLQEYYNMESTNKLADEYEKSDIKFTEKLNKILKIISKIKKITDRSDNFLKEKLWNQPGRTYIFNFFNYQKNPYELQIELNDYAILAIGSGSGWEKLNNNDKYSLNGYYQKLINESQLKFDNNKNLYMLNENEKNILLKAIVIIYVNEYIENKIINPKIKSINPGNISFEKIIPAALSFSGEKKNILKKIQLILYFLTKSNKNELKSYITELEKL